VLELQTLGLEQGVDQVEDVESNATAVDLGEDVADLVELEVSIELDVGDLVLLRDALQMLAEGARVLRAAVGILGGGIVAIVFSDSIEQWLTT